MITVPHALLGVRSDLALLLENEDLRTLARAVDRPLGDPDHLPQPGE